MKKILYIILAATMALASCGKMGNGEEGQAAESIGTYIFDGEEFPVHTAVYASNDVSLMIRISPLDQDTEQTTYAVIGIHSSLEGETIDVGTAWNNDDYYFQYEDPVRYYSVYRKLKSGSIMIDRKGNDIFDVKADIVLPDGTDFSFEYLGPIASATL